MLKRLKFFLYVLVILVSTFQSNSILNGIGDPVQQDDVSCAVPDDCKPGPKW